MESVKRGLAVNQIHAAGRPSNTSKSSSCDRPDTPGDVGADELHGSMNDRRLARQRERGPNNGLPAVLGDERGYLPSEWFGRRLAFSLGQVGHAAEVNLIAPEEVCNSGREIVHW
jgi:hypothetical protein